ncbi:MAG: hypothetical protein M3Y87_03750 [Myxococcota bacterium]|nr:hypothetical protein [Myxococcota bacterium]
MKKLVMCSAILALAVGCGDDPVTPVDSGVRTDSGTTGTDSGTTPEDSGTTPEDSGTTPEDSGMTDSGVVAPTLDCATYCGRIMTACTGDNAQFASMDNCMDTCGAYDEGTIDDMAGNTLGCRIYHAGVAATDPVTHCSHAGPLGDGVCGAACESFCTIADDQCPDAYASMGMCMTACAAFTPGDYSTASTSGNTLACRMYHLSVASTQPDPHCGHVTTVSSTCGGL